MAGAVQQTGFRRVKRVGLPRDELKRRKRESPQPPSPWASLRAALDEDAARQEEAEWRKAGSDVVHDENYFNRLQHSANHRWERRGGSNGFARSWEAGILLL